MESFLDVLLYASVTALVILPAVYALALDSVVSSAQHHRRTVMSSLASMRETVTNATGEFDSDPQETREQLEAALESLHDEEAKSIERYELTRVKRALLLPGLFLISAIGLASLAAFLSLPDIVDYGLTVVASLAILGALWQEYRVLRVAEELEAAKAPQLTLDVREKREEPLEWKVDEREEINVNVLNEGFYTTEATQVELRGPESFYYHSGTPWTDPDDSRATLYSKSFDLKRSDTFRYNYQITPRETGTFKIKLRAVSDEFYGEPTHLKVHVKQ